MTDETTAETDRRTIIKGAAWTVPMIAVAAAVPGAAATAEVCPPEDFPGRLTVTRLDSPTRVDYPAYWVNGNGGQPNFDTTRNGGMRVSITAAYANNSGRPLPAGTAIELHLPRVVAGEAPIQLTGQSGTAVFGGFATQSSYTFNGTHSDPTVHDWSAMRATTAAEIPVNVVFSVTYDVRLGYYPQYFDTSSATRPAIIITRFDAHWSGANPCGREGGTRSSLNFGVYDPQRVP